MAEIRLIDVRQSILAENENQAQEIRQNLDGKNVFMLNIMASPERARPASSSRPYAG
jgi:hypothetical protein